MRKRRIFTIGASGYIGRQLNARAIDGFVHYGTSSSVANGLIQLRLESADEFDYRIIQPTDVVLLTASISAPDICANDKARAWAVNVTGTSRFIANVIDQGGRVVFFSSDTVYGEHGDIFDETAKSNPAGEYGEMKAEVEMEYFGNPLFKSIRLSYVFSREDKFTRYLSGCAERDGDVELFHPFYRAIVHREDVIDGVLALAKRWAEFPQQVINFGGPEVLSKIDFAECLKSYAFPSLRFQVTEPNAEFFENRPRVIAMSSGILPELLGRPSRTLSQAAQMEFV